MKAPERIETPRLLLRRPRPEDADAVFSRYAGDPDVTRFVGWPRHQSVEDTRAFLQFSEAEWQRSIVGPYLIVSQDGARVLGATGLGLETPHRAVTGYVLARDSWARGYATETLEAMVRLARDLGVIRVYALCHTEHRASWRVLEKCGFAREGTLRQYSDFPNLTPGGPHDVLCYAGILN